MSACALYHSGEKGVGFGVWAFTLSICGQFVLVAIASTIDLMME